MAFGDQIFRQKNTIEKRHECQHYFDQYSFTCQRQNA